jgi:hypothetical protein
MGPPGRVQRTHHNRQGNRVGGQPSPLMFVAELRRRGMEFTAGRCVVETDAAAAPQIMSVIRDLELPFILVFNRGRLMVFPQAQGVIAGLQR